MQISLPLVVVVLALQMLPSQALNTIGNHPDCGQQPGDPDAELTFEYFYRDDEFPKYGGRYSTPFKYPWMAVLQILESPSSKYIVAKCSATILNERWALTAAHCLRGKPEQSYPLRPINTFRLLAGRFDLNDPNEREETEQARALKMAIPHPQHDPWIRDFDVALLKLSGPGLRLGPEHKVGAICLPTKENNKVRIDNLRLTMLGWGYEAATIVNNINGPLKERKLRETTSHAWSFWACMRAIKREWENDWYLQDSVGYSESSDSDSDSGSGTSLDDRTKRSICWGQTNTANMCDGESGGPLVAYDAKGSRGRWVQYGVSSWGTFPHVSVAMRVSKFTGWIWATVNQYSTKSDGITTDKSNINDKSTPCEPVRGFFTRNNSFIRLFRSCINM